MSIIATILVEAAVLRSPLTVAMQKRHGGGVKVMTTSITTWTAGWLSTIAPSVDLAGTGANAMGEEAFDEVVIAARRGTLFIRGGYGREELWLGLAKDQCPDGDPDIVVKLTPLMRQRLIEALTEMPTPPSELCWFCEAVLWYPKNSKGHIPVEADVTCEVCGGVMRTVEDEDDERGPTIAMAPVRCGHGVAHDECCYRCAAPENDGRKQRT